MLQLRQDVYHVQTRHALLDNSITVKVGDLIRPTTDGDIVTNASVAGDVYVLGLVVGFCKSNEEVISQGQDPSYTPNQLTTAADNTTVAKYHAVYIPITPEMEFRMTLDDVAGTTPLSDKAFVWFNLADCRTVNEASVVNVTDTSVPLQVFSLGLDPQDTTNHTIIGRIAKTVMSRP
jgi:hypothetical protein